MNRCHQNGRKQSTISINPTVDHKYALKRLNTFQPKLETEKVLEGQMIVASTTVMIRTTYHPKQIFITKSSTVPALSNKKQSDQRVKKLKFLGDFFQCIENNEEIAKGNYHDFFPSQLT